LTAYALGEVDGAIALDDESARIVEETALIASVLREHYRPRRRRQVIKYAMAAVVVMVGFAIFAMSNRQVRQEEVAFAPIPLKEAKAQAPGTPILRLAPVMAETAEFTALTSANFRGIPALDVEQLVSVVIEDASRVGSFTSLRLTSEADVMFQ
jgi:hypothetical protein